MPDEHAVDHYDERELDELLDRALASYVNAEPGPALRVRIMESKSQPSRRLPWLWAFGFAAVCVFALLVSFLSLPTHPIADAPVIARSPRPPMELPPPPARAVRSHLPIGQEVPRRREKFPHKAVFPTPTPLTAEEDILLKFATEHPVQARQALAAFATGPVETEPLTVAPIHIAALSEARETQNW